MTDTPDPRIEAVAKLLFTGPLVQQKAENWGQSDDIVRMVRSMCLMAAEDVLRGIDEATAWEYGIRTVGASYADGWLGMTADEAEEHVARLNARDETRGYSTRAHVIRRHPASEPEPMP